MTKKTDKKLFDLERRMSQIHGRRSSPGSSWGQTKGGSRSVDSAKSSSNHSRSVCRAKLDRFTVENIDPGH